MVRLGLRVEEFWGLTPAEFFYIRKEYEKKIKEDKETLLIREEMANWRMGVICSVIANCNRRKGGKVFRPSDFMPKMMREKKKKMTAEEMYEETKKITIMLGGEVKE